MTQIKDKNPKSFGGVTPLDLARKSKNTDGYSMMLDFVYYQ